MRTGTAVVAFRLWHSGARQSVTAQSARSWRLRNRSVPPPALAVPQFDFPHIGASGAQRAVRPNLRLCAPPPLRGLRLESIRPSACTGTRK